MRGRGRGRRPEGGDVVTGQLAKRTQIQFIKLASYAYLCVSMCVSVHRILTHTATHFQGDTERERKSGREREGETDIYIFPHMY